MQPFEALMSPQAQNGMNQRNLVMYKKQRIDVGHTSILCIVWFFWFLCFFSTKPSESEYSRPVSYPTKYRRQ